MGRPYFIAPLFLNPILRPTMKCIKEQGLLQSKCNTFIADAITIVEEMIQEQELENNE